MTVEAMTKFYALCSANANVAREAGVVVSNTPLMSMFASLIDILAEREGKPKGGEERPVYDGIIHLEQLLFSLKSTVGLLHGFGCDSLSDITGYLIQDGKLLFRVKGRLAAAPVNYRHEDIDLLNYTRYYVGLLPLVEETKPLD